MQSLHEVCVEGVKLDKEESYQGWSNGVGLNMHKGDNNRGLRGHDQCDARSDRRRPRIRVGASKVGGGVAVMKCGLTGRPWSW